MSDCGIKSKYPEVGFGVVGKKTEINLSVFRGFLSAISSLVSLETNPIAQIPFLGYSIMQAFSNELSRDDKIVSAKIDSLFQYKEKRNDELISKSIEKLKNAVINSENIMPISIECAKNGLTTGEWAGALREVFGEYRPPTGTGISTNMDHEEIETVRDKVKVVSTKLGRPIKILVGKPGLDGHSNGAEQIAVRARDVGMEVIYHGIRLTPEEIVSTVEQEDVDLVGLSILSGSHLTVVPKIVEIMKNKGCGSTPIIVGGIIPDDDHKVLKDSGVRAVYTPKDYSLNKIMEDFARIVDQDIANA